MPAIDINSQRLILDSLKFLGVKITSITGVCFGTGQMGRQALTRQQHPVFNKRMILLEDILKKAYKKGLENFILTYKQTHSDPLVQTMQEYQGGLFLAALKKLEQNALIRMVFEILPLNLSEKNFKELSPILDPGSLTDEVRQQLNKQYQQTNNELFEEVKKEFQNQISKLSKEDNIDIHAFFNGLAVYQDPDAFPYLFPEEEVLRQENLPAFDLVSPSKTKKDIEIKEFEFTNSFNLKELRSYIQILRSAASELANAQIPIVFVFINIDHTITLGFDIKEKVWLLCEPNELDEFNENRLAIQKLPGDYEVADKNFKSLEAKKDTVFFTQIFVPEGGEKKAKNILSKLQWPTITDAKIKIVSDYRNVNILDIAVVTNDFRSVLSALKLGADVRRPSPEGYSLLKAAIYNKNAFIAGALLRYGADPHEKDSAGWTPLHESVSLGLVDLSGLLIQHKSNVNEVCEMWAINLFKFAWEKGYWKVGSIDEFLKIFKLEEDSEGKIPSLVSGFTPLHMAVFYNKFDLVKLLLENGADPNICTSKGVSPLDIANGMKHYQITYLLTGKKYVETHFNLPKKAQMAKGLSGFYSISEGGNQTTFPSSVRDVEDSHPDTEEDEDKYASLKKANKKE